ncbi:MAG TPA: PAS domain S-box protein [Trichocoleus sp.]
MLQGTLLFTYLGWLEPLSHSLAARTLAIALGLVSQLVLGVILFRQSLDSQQGSHQTFRQDGADGSNSQDGGEAEWFRLIADNVDHVFWVVKLSNPPQHLYINPAYETVFGLARERLYQNSQAFLEGVHPADLPNVVAALGHLAETGERFEQTFRIVRPDGTLRWIHAQAFALLNREGIPYCSVGLAEDITEQKQATLALQESETRLKMALEAAQIVCWENDLTTGKVQCIGQFGSAGWSPTAWKTSQARVFQELIPEVEQEAVLHNIQTAIAQGGDYYSEHSVLTAEQQFIWVLDRGKILTDLEGKPQKLIGLSMNITERKALERALQESQSQLADILNNALACIVQYRLYPDHHFTYDFWSEGAEAVFGFTAQEFMQDTQLWFSRVLPEDIEAVVRPVWERIRLGETTRIEYRFRHKDGTLRWIASAATSHWNAEAGCWICTVIDTDISDLKQAEENLRRFERVFSATVDAVALLDHNYRYLLVNDAYLNRFKKSRHEILGQPVANIIGAEVFAACKHYLEGCLTGEEHQFEFWFEHPAVGREFISVTYAPYRELDGTVSGIVASIRNLTDLKQAETNLRAERDLLNGVMNTSIAAIVVLDPKGNLQFANPQAEQILGISQKELKERTYNSLEWQHTTSESDPWAEHTQPFRQVLSTGEAVQDARLAIRWPDGQRRLLSVNGAPIKDTQGQIVNLVFTVNDITERIAAETALRESETRFRLLAENMLDLVCLHALDGTYIYVSPSCQTVLGYVPEELMGTSPYALLHPEDCDRIWSEAHQLALKGQCVPVTYRIRCDDGQYLWFETLINPIYSEAGQVIQLQTTSRNVTDKVEIQAKLEHDALYDALTGLPNRSLLMERLNSALERLHQHADLNFAVLFLDLDRFKIINDSMGHQVGDALLFKFARKLKEIVRSIDVAARLSGDEFVLLLEEVEDTQDAVRVAERILAELQEPFILQGREVFVNTSIGIVIGSRHYAQGLDLLRDADIAMYRAKNSGKACYAIFDPQMHLQVLREMHLENALRSALEHRQFILHYQPIVCLKTGQIKGFEALVRWQHPHHGLIPPSDFISLAEETGLIVPLGSQVLEIACHQLSKWHQRYSGLPPLTMSINLSAKQLSNPNLIAQLDRALTQTGLDPCYLTLEITESVLIKDIENTITVLKEIRDRGIGLTIDDFGTGYSSLSYLHRFPFTALKIDKSFVAQLDNSKEDPGLVKTILALADSLGLDVIAEGIETEHHLTALKAIHCEFGQGFLFSKGLTVSQIEASLPQVFKLVHETESG